MNKRLRHYFAVMGARTWTMRGGTKIRWADMSASHLRNSVAMLRRNAAAWRGEANAAASYCGGGEIASDMADEVARSAPRRAAQAEALAAAMERYVNTRERCRSARRYHEVA